MNTVRRLLSVVSLLLILLILTGCSTFRANISEAEKNRRLDWVRDARAAGVSITLPKDVKSLFLAIANPLLPGKLVGAVLTYVNRVKDRSVDEVMMTASLDAIATNLFVTYVEYQKSVGKTACVVYAWAGDQCRQPIVLPEGDRVFVAMVQFTCGYESVYGEIRAVRHSNTGAVTVWKTPIVRKSTDGRLLNTFTGKPLNISRSLVSRLTCAAASHIRKNAHSLSFKPFRKTKM